METTVIRPGSIPDPAPRFSQGLLAGNLLFIAGQISVDEKWTVIGEGDIEAQTRQVYKNIGAILQEAGMSFDNLVMTTTYLVDLKYKDGFNRVRSGYYKKNPPTSTTVVVKDLAVKGCLIEIAAIAMR
jgi:2-iminobutanoate/2-iminopropanoate deaminase